MSRTLSAIAILLFAWSTAYAQGQPNAVASAPQSNVVEQTNNVVLDGSASSDPDMDPLIYLWEQIGGPGVAIDDASSAMTTFDAPVVLIQNSPAVLTFRLTVTDDEVPAQSNSAQVQVSVTAENQDPTANAGNNQTVDEGQGVNLNGNGSSDSDGNIAAYSWSQTGGPGVMLNGANSATPSFTAPSMNTGDPDIQLQFTLTVTDNEAAQDSDTVNITVQAVNGPPTANNQSVTTDEDMTVGITLTGSDPDGDPLTFEILDQPDDGSLSGSGANRSYTPDADFNGNDSFTFRITAGGQTSNTATVSITVDPVNDGFPVAQNDGPYTANEGGNVMGSPNVLANDSDPDDDPMTAVLASGPSNAATFNLQSNGNFTYRHDGSETTSDSFTYRANDGFGASNLATVTINITPINDPPEADDVNARTDEDMSVAVVLSASDTDGDPLTYMVVNGPSNGNLSGNAPNLTYTPNPNYNGNDNFRYVANDGIVNSNSATVSIRIDPVNDRPVLDDPIDDQQAVEASPFNLDISGNFVDPDNESLTYSATGLPPSGVITFNTNNGRFSGTPQFDDARDTPYPITVTATDGAGERASDIFQLTIAALDRANVGLQISAAPTPAMLNDEVMFNFSIDNIGPQGGQNIDLDGTFIGSNLVVTPSGATTCTTQSPNNSETNFSCMLGDLGIGATTSLSISATSPNPGSISVAATAAGRAPVPIDPDTTNNSLYVSVGVAEQFSNGSVQVLGNSQILSMAAGDLNNDGADDIVLGTVAGLPAQVFLSDGYRAFGAPLSIADSSAHNGVALADFDNDGALDVVFANAGVPDTVFRNNGTGTFTLLDTLPGATLSNSVAVGDFDTDNNMDIVFAVTGGNPVYTGNGNGGFTLADTLGSADSRDVAVGLLDGNARPDIIVANVGERSALWVGNASAVFPNNPERTFNIGDTSSVVIAELVGSDNAQALDVAFGRIPSAVGDIPENLVMSNNGSGNLSVNQRLGSVPTSDILAGDVNRDGQNDLVFLNDTDVHQVWYRSGNGFDLHIEQIVADGAVAGVLTELGEIEIGDDGGVDLAMGGMDIPGAGVFLNDGFGNLGKGDAVAPTMTLNAEDPFNVPAGSPFVDPGVTAIDNIDGDISARAVATGDVNDQVVGTYSVTYTVMDAAGNEAEPITREVIISVATGTGGGGGGVVAPLTIVLTLATMLLAALRRPRHRNSNGRNQTARGQKL